MFHCAHALIQSLLNLMFSLSVKRRSNNYSSGDIDKDTTKIQTGDISQLKAVREYVIPGWTLARKCNNKIENVSEKRPVSLSMLGEAAEKYLVQWVLAMQKRGISLGREMIIQKVSEIHRYMFGSTHFLGSVGQV